MIPQIWKVRVKLTKTNQRDIQKLHGCVSFNLHLNRREFSTQNPMQTSKLIRFS
jgi:hypothetical protein